MGLRLERIDSAKTARRTARRVSRGMQSIEVLLTLPLVVLTLVSGVHYGIAGVTKQTMQCAASAAANEAALGGSEIDVRKAADKALAVHELEIGPGILLLIEDESGVQFAVGDKSVFPEEAKKESRKLVPGEVRAKLFVARSATGVPEAINFMGTEIKNHDLAAVATSIRH